MISRINQLIQFGLFLLGALVILNSCGRALPITPEGLLGDAVAGDTGTRTDGSNLGSLYTVYQMETGVGGGSIPGWAASDLPLNVAAIAFNTIQNDRQTPFSFTYDYPANNFKLANAQLLIDTQRDGSDTEGIFVDGVQTGSPPIAMIQATSPKLLYKHYAGSGNPLNNYYMSYSLAHYAQLTRNTFNLAISELLKPTILTEVDVLEDGFLPVVTGDDSPIFQAYLIIKGYTISKTPLDCEDSDDVTFQNVYLHNDGNSITSPAFTGTVESPITSWSSVVAGFKSVEFYFDAFLPQENLQNISLTTGTITMNVKRNSDPVAIVVNGVGVSSAGFDRTKATVVVERWDDTTAATNALTAFLLGIPTNESSTAVTLDLNGIFGDTAIETLIAQGKLNIALAGGIRAAEASAATSSRAVGVPVNGPRLNLAGTHFIEVCEVPDDPTSPLSDDNPLPVGATDETSPQVMSAQATEITSTSAAIQWLTDEGATTQIGYGVGNVDTLTVEDTSLVTFHRVVLTGLSPYKYYYFQIRTTDGNSNQTIYSTKVFRTLR